MKKIAFIFAIMPFLAKAQDIVNNGMEGASDQQRRTNVGIQWTKGLTWQQIKDKAKAEYKYIFVDCYATWCAPCKWMDKNVFTSDTVGEYINSRFISIKVQMDTSKLDNEETKAWYKDAKQIMNAYKVISFPAYLFFTPQGEIVHQDVGAKTAADFVTLSEEAIDPNKQYFSLLNKYKSGQIDSSTMIKLALIADRYGDRKIAMNIANEYIETYILSNNRPYTLENVRFVGQFTRRSADKGFSILYHNAKKVDAILNSPGYAQSLVNYIISKEEIDPVTKAAENSIYSPSWDSLKLNIKRRYNKYYAERAVLDAKKRWYRYKKDYPEAAKYFITYLNNYGSSMNNWDLNLDAWFIAQHSKKEKELKTAINWIEEVVSTENDSMNLLPASLDTYANLLYKVGKKEKALEYEEKALSLAVKYKISNFIKAFQANIEKMKKGEIIW